MKFEVFNKRPSKKDVKEARRYSCASDQAEALANATAPKKGRFGSHQPAALS